MFFSIKTTIIGPQIGHLPLKRVGDTLCLREDGSAFGLHYFAFGQDRLRLGRKNKRAYFVLLSACTIFVPQKERKWLQNLFLFVLRAKTARD